MRDYEAIAATVAPQADRTKTMQLVVDRLWEALSSQGVSWAGFYVKDPDAEQMFLGPHRDKPACSPIGLHGACGQAYRSKRPMVVRDVQELGSDYIACDPRDQSEVVIPFREPDGICWGVLDLDSHDIGAFSPRDVAGLCRVLAAAGFQTP